MARWAWRQLTSMRTALMLLFLLALAAIPGSLIPQQGVDPVAVARAVSGSASTVTRRCSGSRARFRGVAGGRARTARR